MTSRAPYAAVAAGLAACFPIELVMFAFTTYEHYTAADQSHDVWGGLALGVVGVFILTAFMLVGLLAAVDDENAADRWTERYVARTAATAGTEEDSDA